jgi:hypothetical protein
MTGPPADSPPSSRWVILPGDPPALRTWLAAQAGDQAPEDWPREEAR